MGRSWREAKRSRGEHGMEPTGGETELPGGETEPAAGWNGAAGDMGRGGGAGSWNLWFL